MITSVGRRRRWSLEDKERLVAATFEPEAVISDVARSAGIHVSQLFRWRKELCQISAPSLQQFVPIEVVAALPPPDPVCQYRSMYGCPRSCKAFIERFGRVIGCGHVSGLSSRPDFGRWPVWITRTWCKSILRAHGSLLRMHFQAHSHRSLSLPFVDLLTRRRSHLATVQRFATPRPGWNSCKFRSSSSWRRSFGPSCSQGQLQRACGACAPTSVQAKSFLEEPSGMPIGSQSSRR